MNDIQTRVWSKLKYKSPKPWLEELDRLEKEVVPRVVRTRPRLLDNRANWARQAGIFTYGMEKLTSKRISFAMNDVEDSEVDLVALFAEDEIINFVPVQLKEWVPENIDQKHSLDKIYIKLREYALQSELTVAIYVCRDVKLKIDEVRLHGTQFSGVWIFGACSEDKKKWFLMGDVQKKEPKYFEFDYPIAS